MIGSDLATAKEPSDFASTAAVTQQVKFETPATKPSLMNTASLKQLYVVENKGADASKWPEAAASDYFAL